MNATLLYCLQTILSAGLFILIYRLFVRNTNTYNWNRFYLLSTMTLSLLLPFMDISVWFSIDKPIILYTSALNTITVSANHQMQNSITLSEILLTGYWVIVGLLLLRFGWGIIRIIDLAINNKFRRHGTLRLYPIVQTSTFSFFNYVFIQPEHWEKPITEYIIRHEQAHVNHLHSIDNLLTELMLVFGWFNPFYYIFRRDLHLLHECQADQVVLNSGCDKTTYHQLLLNEATGNYTYILANQFSYSLIKRRFRMISNNKKSPYTKFRILVAVPTAFVLLLLFSFTSLKDHIAVLNTSSPISNVKTSSNVIKANKNTPIEKKLKPVVAKPTPTEEIEKPLLVVEQNPEFQGGYDAMLKFLHDRMQYPATAQEAGIKGTVFVQFVVSKTGTISNAKILRGIGGGCDEEAINVVKQMPKWIPGRQNGQAVPVMFQIPVKFQLQMN
jgi:TonB family protein